MIARALAALALLFAAPALARTPTPFAPVPAGERVIYRGATLIDGRGGKPQTGMAVVTNGETIEAVVPASALTPGQLAAATVVDLKGKFLLPGLIDSHQHLATPPDRKRAEALMRRDLYSGITATRIMADDLRSLAELARAARLGEIASPDLYFAALVAGPSFFDDPRTSAAAQDMVPGTAPWMQRIDDATDLPLAIARAKGTGATALKIYANLPPHLVKALAAEAHRQDMAVWAHGMVFPTRPVDVIAAGPDVISHTCYLAYQLSANPPQTYQQRSPIDPAPFVRDNPVMSAMFADMAKRGIILDPTLRVYRESERRAPPGRPPYCSLDLAAKLTAQAHRAGVKMSAGTDGDTPASDAYPGVFEELELLVAKAGLSPMQAIEAATRIGAETMGQGASQGIIAPGYLANLVVLTRDPIRDIANMRSVETTVKRGRRLGRAYYVPISAGEIAE